MRLLFVKLFPVLDGSSNRNQKRDRKYGNDERLKNWNIGRVLRTLTSRAPDSRESQRISQTWRATQLDRQPWKDGAPSRATKSALWTRVHRTLRRNGCGRTMTLCKIIRIREIQQSNETCHDTHDVPCYEGKAADQAVSSIIIIPMKWRGSLVTQHGMAVPANSKSAVKT